MLFFFIYILIAAIDMNQSSGEHIFGTKSLKDYSSFKRT